jgi:hypothetical protein
MLDVLQGTPMKITMKNADTLTLPIDAATNDRIDTLTAITMLAVLAGRGDRHAREVLRRFDRGEPVDDLGVPASWPKSGD